MRCWRSFFKLDFCRYLDGELEQSSVARFEDHLLNCGTCRALLARLRNGHRLATQIPLPAPARDRWDAIEATLESQQVRPERPNALRKMRVAPSLRLGAVILTTIRYPFQHRASRSNRRICQRTES
jgi:anti-sigma factor RsiW